MCKRWAFVSCVCRKAAQKLYDGWNLLELLRERSMRRVGVSLQIAPQLHKSSKVWVSLFEVKGQRRSCGKMNRELVRQYRQARLVYRFQLSTNKMRLLNMRKKAMTRTTLRVTQCMNDLVVTKVWFISSEKRFSSHCYMILSAIIFAMQNHKFEFRCLILSSF